MKNLWVQWSLSKATYQNIVQNGPKLRVVSQNMCIKHTYIESCFVKHGLKRESLKQGPLKSDATVMKPEILIKVVCKVQKKLNTAAFFGVE